MKLKITAMQVKSGNKISRRSFIRNTSAAAIGISMIPAVSRCVRKPKLMTRSFGRLNHEVTTFGLGGQASIQWTPVDVDPVAIILKAFDQRVNYFDTSNLYGPSQINYGKAFRKLSLIPGESGYNESLRRSIFLTSKSHLRFAKGNIEMEGLHNWSNGSECSHTIDDLKRSISQIFGDGKEYYPKGAYLDMVLIHSVTSMADVEAVYTGLDHTDSRDECIGALAALRDYRDGTNLTGLNPDEEKLIRHIGFSGHYHAGVMMNMIRRDKENLLDGLLVAINSNDKLNLNMQYNVIPVAKAKNMGVIGMKVFADGAMYSKEAHWSNQPSDVVREVGTRELPFKPLIQYTLTTPGINTAIIGIGQISDDPRHCQLTQNIQASQILPEGLSEADRNDVEGLTRHIKQGKTNYFQSENSGLSGGQNLQIRQVGEKQVEITWDSAYAHNYPIDRYEIFRNEVRVGEVTHRPQTNTEPFHFMDEPKESGQLMYRVITVDKGGNKAETEISVIV
jgi:predicted aldo/keto reductase-like oxidoreductase